MDIQTFVQETQRQINSIERRLNYITSGAVSDQLVNLDVIGAPTYTNLHQWLNNTCSAMRISGGLITDSGGGEIDVAAGTGILKTTDDPLGENRQFNWGVETNLALANNETNWIGIEYNAGVPQVKIETDLSNFNFHDDFVLGRVYRSGATLYILNAGSYYDNFQHRVCYRIFEVDQFRRALGGIIADEGLLDFSITEGRWYCGTTVFTTAAWDCSGADRFTYWYRDGVGGWTTVGAQADIDNLNYDDGVPPLGALGAGRYGVHWVYLAHDGSVHVQYGQGNYKHFEAESALVPAGPDFFLENCELVGKIIVGQGDATLTDVLSAFEVIFIGQAANIHNDLGGLQGGQADQYYHLTAAEHGYVSGVNAQSLLTTASPSFVALGLGVGELTAGSINRAAGVLTLEIGGSGIGYIVGADGIGVFASNPSVVLAADIGGHNINCLNAAGAGYLTAQGSTVAGVNVVDSGAAVNQKWFQFRCDGGIGSFVSVKDNASAFQAANIITCGLNNGEIGFGGLPIAGSKISIYLSTENFEIKDAGSVGATEQDWIEVEIGGVVGYIRVFAAK